MIICKRPILLNDHFWSRPRLRLRLAHGFISKSGATYVQVEMKIQVIVLSLAHFWPKHNVLYWFLIFKTLDGAKSKHELVCIGNKKVHMEQHMRLVSTSRLRLRPSKEQFRDSRPRLRLCKCLRRDRDESLVSSRSEKWSRLRVSPTPDKHYVWCT